MTEACEECGAEEKLYPFWEWMLCYECRKIARQAEAINAKDDGKEDMRLMKG